MSDSSYSTITDLMEQIDGKKWLCKTTTCYIWCDSHPCLIEKGLLNHNSQPKAKDEEE